METKMKETEWRKQATERIMLIKEEKNSFFGSWIDWETYVREKVIEKKLKTHCLSIFDDAGGKPAATSSNDKEGGSKEHVKHYDLVEAGSPLKYKKTRCSVHSFKEETNKVTARKGSNYILDGIVCEGVVNHPCGALFVEHVQDIENTEDRNRARIVSIKEPAFWCETCNLVLCHHCHLLYCDSQSRRGRRGRLALDD
jgi:hypothetical protein